MKNCFLNIGGVNIRGRIKCILFADDMTLLEEDKMMLKNILMELNDICDYYGMKIDTGISYKKKTMVIGRKPKKITN